MTYLIIALISLTIVAATVLSLKTILSDDSMELDTESALSEEEFVLNRLPSN